MTSSPNSRTRPHGRTPEVIRAGVCTTSSPWVGGRPRRRSEMTEATVTEYLIARQAGEEATGAVPSIVDHPCRHYGPDALSWPAHPELTSFMHATYEAHVARSCRYRAFQPSVP